MTQGLVVIVDYGMGNLRSVQSKLALLEINATISAKPDDITRATKLILPGVGNFAMGMRNLSERGLNAALDEAVLRKKTPVLGICLGMQLLGVSSEEGNVKGLGWLNTRVVRFQFKEQTPRLRVPHVGWNKVNLIKRESILFRDIPVEKPFYFTHSYYAASEDPGAVVATSTYGHEFVSVVEKENVFGTQFHPEKSRAYGLRIIENFVRLS